jgi:hypothetical protein
MAPRITGSWFPAPHSSAGFFQSGVVHFQLVTSYLPDHGLAFRPGHQKFPSIFLSLDPHHKQTIDQ